MSIDNPIINSLTKNKVSWRLTVDFNMHKHLLYDKVKTDYEIEAFSCSCGHINFIIKQLHQQIKYICPECKNIDFYDAGLAWKDINYFLFKNESLNLSFEYDIRNNYEGVKIQYVTWVPHNIDFLRNKIIFDKRSIYGLELTIDGDIKKEYEIKYNNKTLIELEKRLAKYINVYQPFEIPYLDDRDMSLTQISFFLKHKHLKEFNFYYWKNVYKISKEPFKEIDIDTSLRVISNFRKEKSVRRAIYANYENQMKNTYAFESQYIDIFTKTIEDPNILVKFLELDIDLMEEFDNGFSAILVFLKRYYTEKQILKLLSINSNTSLLQDVIGMFSYDEDTISLKFRRTKCNIKNIHDEFTRCINTREYSEIPQYEFKYTNIARNPCITLNHHYTVQVPENNRDLYRWGDHMHNCISEYENRIKNGETILYGFFSDKKLQFIVEIKDRKIVEANRRYNHPLNQEEMDILEIWFSRFFE